MSESILTNKNVLVAEDNAINQMVVKHTLLKLGAGADIAGDGAEAVEKFKKHNYDLILMDIQMPLMDGYEATTYIRNQLCSNVPIVAMTAFALHGEEKKCFACGMNSYISKPFTVESLSQVIEKVLSVQSEVPYNSHILTANNVSVDLSMLYDICGDDESYISVMMQTFLENMPNTVRDINESLQREDWDALFKAAHRAKSSLSVVKVSKMLESVLLVEDRAKNRMSIDTIARDVEKINEAFAIAQQLLSKKVASARNSYS